TCLYFIFPAATSQPSPPQHISPRHSQIPSSSPTQLHNLTKAHHKLPLAPSQSPTPFPFKTPLPSSSPISFAKTPHPISSPTSFTKTPHPPSSPTSSTITSTIDTMHSYVWLVTMSEARQEWMREFYSNIDLWLMRSIPDHLLAMKLPDERPRVLREKAPPNEELLPGDFEALGLYHECVHEHSNECPYLCSEICSADCPDVCWPGYAEHLKAIVFDLPERLEEFPEELQDLVFRYWSDDDWSDYEYPNKFITDSDGEYGTYRLDMLDLEPWRRLIPTRPWSIEEDEWWRLEPTEHKPRVDHVAEYAKEFDPWGRPVKDLPADQNPEGSEEAEWDGEEAEWDGEKVPADAEEAPVDAQEAHVDAQTPEDAQEAPLNTEEAELDAEEADLDTEEDHSDSQPMSDDLAGIYDEWGLPMETLPDNIDPGSSQKSFSDPEPHHEEYGPNGNYFEFGFDDDQDFIASGDTDCIVDTDAEGSNIATDEDFRPLGARGQYESGWVEESEVEDDVAEGSSKDQVLESFKGRMITWPESKGLDEDEDGGYDADTEGEEDDAPEASVPCGQSINGKTEPKGQSTKDEPEPSAQNHNDESEPQEKVVDLARAKEFRKFLAELIDEEERTKCIASDTDVDNTPGECTTSEAEIMPEGHGEDIVQPRYFVSNNVEGLLEAEQDLWEYGDDGYDGCDGYFEEEYDDEDDQWEAPEPAPVLPYDGDFYGLKWRDLDWEGETPEDVGYYGWWTDDFEPDLDSRDPEIVVMARFLVWMDGFGPEDGIGEAYEEDPECNVEPFPEDGGMYDPGAVG
ncbi:hypothetical protein EJ06DRAFT_354158, partial [Trichodelitschia bisporula]